MGDWFNLGYWARADGFAEAALELARLLGRAAGLGPGLKILDAGFGGGAQLSVWLEEFQVAEVTGVELHDSPAFAENRRRPRERLRLARGDAARLSRRPDLSGEYHRVLALDCAYHFNRREDFLRDAFALLRKGGRLALTDLVPRANVRTLARRVLYWACGLPAANMYGKAEYVSLLESMGFGNVRIRLLDRSVLGGFGRFARSNRLNRGYPMAPLDRIKFLLTGLLLGNAQRRRIFHYVLVTAEKK